MTEELKQTIEREIKALPKEGQEAIGALDWIKATEEIGEKFSLTEEELDDLQLETLLVLIGIVDWEFYAVNIGNHVGTTKEQAGQIAEEAFQKIFSPIKNILVENIKKDLKTKDPDWQQTINFILSGGNYLAFAEPSSPLEDSMPDTPQSPGEKSGGSGNSEKSDDIKLKLVI